MQIKFEEKETVFTISKDMQIFKKLQTKLKKYVSMQI